MGFGMAGRTVEPSRDPRAATDPVGSPFAKRGDMRTALILAFASMFAATSVACAVETVGSGTSLSKKPKKADDGDDDDDSTGNVDDDGDREGEVGPRQTGSDPSNPNLPANVPASTPQAAQGFSLAVDNPKTSVDLASEATISVTITPKNGFTGTVNLSVDGLPAGVTAAPASGTPGTPVTLKLVSTTSAPISAADIPLTVKGVSGAQTATAPTSFRVNNQVTMTIPVNAGALLAAGGGAKTVDGWGGDAFGPAATPLLVPAGQKVEVKVKNLDSTPRQIHGPNGNGFAHGNEQIPPGAYEGGNANPRIRAFGPGVNTSGYLHGPANGNAVGFKLVTKAAE
jgi:hypothetical protein